MSYGMHYRCGNVGVKNFAFLHREILELWEEMVILDQLDPRDCRDLG